MKIRATGIDCDASGLERAIRVIGGKWKVRIICHLLGGTKRAPTAPRSDKLEADLSRRSPWSRWNGGGAHQRSPAGTLLARQSGCAHTGADSAALAGGEGMLSQDVQALSGCAPGHGIRNEVVRQPVARVRSVFRPTAPTPSLL